MLLLTETDIATALANLNAAAKRCPRIVGDTTIPTDWDLWHRRLDQALDDWERRMSGAI